MQSLSLRACRNAGIARHFQFGKNLIQAHRACNMFFWAVTGFYRKRDFLSEVEMMRVGKPSDLYNNLAIFTCARQPGARPVGLGNIAYF